MLKERSVSIASRRSSAGPWAPARPSSGAAQYPDMVEAIVPLCGFIKNRPFQQGVSDLFKRALELDPVFANGSTRHRRWKD